MATAVKTKPIARTQEEVETKEEPKVIADANLGKILKKYNEAEKQTTSIWLQIVEYCKENELTRDVLKATYIQYRGVTEGTANVEVTMIMSAIKAENEENLEAALAGDMTVRDFRKSLMKPREGKSEADPEKKLTTKLKQVCRYAIEHADIDEPKEFGRLARETFVTVLERYTEEKEEGDAAGTDGESDEEEAE